jgi:mono/diheme cytochrome c family protein
LHWSSKGDGAFDRHTVFIDKLVMPRMILPLEAGRLLVGETDTNDIYLYTDTNGDGVADKKDVWFLGGPRGGNLEHQPSGLIWATDNWLYTSYNAYRLRWTPAGPPIKEPTAGNGGQWGLTQDDHGKPWFIDAGGEQGPVNFQTPIVYGAFRAKDEKAGEFATVWPAIGLADFQSGLGRVRPEDKTLNHFTATCGDAIYRGDRLPAELRGDLFFGEPVGRLVRRAKVEVREGLTYLTNPYQAQKSEFIRSTDPLFRPINMLTAPDGTLYIVDVYRGIIQEGNWVREGSYLRKVVEQYAMDKPVGMGRIWRLVHDSAKPGPQPKMSSETPAQLVAHLEHPNGWWRDTAQKLLVLKQDKSVVPALTAMARTSKSYLGRLHALWTLEGLDVLTPEIVREKLKDEHPQVRVAAIRVSESLFKKKDVTLQGDILAMAKDIDANVVIQTMLTAKLLNWPNWKKLTEDLAKSNPSSGVKELATTILNPPVQVVARSISPAEKKLFDAGQAIYQGLCVTCHGPDGKGMPMIGAGPDKFLGPPLAGSKTVTGFRDGPVYVQLQGLTGDIEGKHYEGLMISMATNDDTWIASVLSYVRNSFGNHASFIEPTDVARVRAATKDRTQPWTIGELRAVLPKALRNRNEWKLTASHNGNDVRAAVDGDAGSRYTTNASQAPGMWFQIELPQEAALAGVELDSTKSRDDYPRGYKIELSGDGQIWKQIAAGKGEGPVTNVSFPAERAKFVKITQTGAVDGLFWSIHELEIFAPGEAVKVAQIGVAK